MQEQSRSVPGVQHALDALTSVAVIIAAAAFVWNSTSTRSTRNPPTPAGRASQRAALAPPKEPLSLDEASVEGSRSAPVAIVEYSDFQCPFCGQFARDTLPKLREKYVRPGKALIAFRYLPLKTIHASAEKAAEAAECAARQGQFWQMHDHLFKSQQQLDDPAFRSIAAGAGMDIARFGRCLAGEAVARVDADLNSATRFGITGTPTFFVGLLEGGRLVQVSKVVTGMQTLEQFDSTLADILAPKQAKR